MNACDNRDYTHKQDSTADVLSCSVQIIERKWVGMRVIMTERFVLRPFRAEDVTAMYRNWCCDERVARYCKWCPHESIAVTKELLRKYLTEADDGFEYRWAITKKEADEPIGCIDVVGFGADGRTPEIGYVLSHAEWGKGCMTEVLQAVITYLFSCGYSEIIARHHVENLASGRVMEKCGMHMTGYTKIQEKFGSDQLCDVKCYAISTPQQTIKTEE